MPIAIRTRDLPTHQARQATVASGRARVRGLAGVTSFESMTPAQKDVALKELLIRAKLIPESS
jgi:hypothetical protein